MKHIFLFVLFLSVLSSASFDCDKAESKLENLICNNKQLNKLDSKLGIKFFSIRNQLKKEDAKEFLQKQKTWLKDRKNICNYNNSTCLIDLYKKRIKSIEIGFENKIQKNSHLRNFCNQIKDDYEISIEECVFNQDCLAKELSKSSSGIIKYKSDKSIINNYGYTEIIITTASTSAKGTSLVQLDRFQGDRHTRFKESRLVNTKELNEILSLPRSKEKKYSDNSKVFQDLINKGQKVSNYKSYLYYAYGVGDIIITPNCEISFEYGAIEKCSDINGLDVLLVYSSKDTEKICHFDNIETNTGITEIEQAFLHAKKASKRLEALKKMKQLAPDKQYKYNRIALNDRDAMVRLEGIRYLRGPQKQTIPLMLNIIVNDSDKQNKTSALFNMSPPFTNNGAEPCKGFPIIEENLDLAFNALDSLSYSKELTIEMLNVFGSGSNCCKTIKKENIERIYNRLESQLAPEYKTRYEQCLNTK